MVSDTLSEYSVPELLACHSGHIAAADPDASQTELLSNDPARRARPAPF
ncbi:hypothetical protein [Primorskyibacter flagellatus]|nr:hypothetical protein [Primorskyibacter flagellatus]